MSQKKLFESQIKEIEYKIALRASGYPVNFLQSYVASKNASPDRSIEGSEKKIEPVRIKNLT